MGGYEATINTGAMSSSRARFKNEKHSISNMCTSSMNRTCLFLKNKPLEMSGLCDVTRGIPQE